MITLIDYDNAATSFDGDIGAAIRLFRKESTTYARLECKHHRAGSFVINRLSDDSLSFDWKNHNKRSLNY
jgi:hypothetical protein